MAQDKMDFNVPDRPVQTNLELMAVHLKKDLGEDMVSIAMSFHTAIGQILNSEPAPEGSLNVLLSQVGTKNFILDLGSVPTEGPANDWFNQRQIMYIDWGGTVTLNPKKSYDAIIYIDTVHQGVPTKAAMEKFKDMN